MRLHISCIGAGRQRYIFKVVATEPPEFMQHCSNNDSSPSVFSASTSIVTISASNTTKLASQLIERIKPGLDIRFHLAWTYGGYLEDIPRRLGINQALDTATEVLVAIHARFREGSQDATAEILSKYGHALTILRRYLNDPCYVYTPETLCAVQLLLICQVRDE